MLVLLFRTLIAFILITVSVRVMGKRQVGQLQVPELVVTIIISQLASLPLIEEGTPILRVAVTIMLLVAYELLLSSLTLLSPKLNKFFYGSPSFLINAGKIDRTEMKKQRVSIEDIFEAMRDKGNYALEDISCVVLETSGHMSIIPKPEKRTATAGDIKIKEPEIGLPVVVLVDGRPNACGLAFYGHDEHWLDLRLDAAGTNRAEVFVFTVDGSGKELIVKRSDTK